MNVHIPPNPYAESLTTNMIVFEGGTFGRYLGLWSHENGTLMMELVPLWEDKKTPEFSLSLHIHQGKAMWAHIKKAAVINFYYQYIHFLIIHSLFKHALCSYRIPGTLLHGWWCKHKEKYSYSQTTFS